MKFSPLVAAVVALIATLAMPGPAAGQPAPSLAELQRSLAGDWSGALGYRDYRTNRLFELPVRTVIENVPDGATQIRRSVYDEGPRQAPVWIVSLLQVGRDDSLTSSIMRAGRDPETIRQLGRIERYAAPTDWVVVYRHTGTDDDKPADIRVTETLKGSELLTVKQVRPAGDTSAPWAFRNQLRLTRVEVKRPTN